MITIENMSKSYPVIGMRRVHVFRNLNLSLPERINIGVIGRNGAGKSTLLRLIAGVEKPDSGRIVTSGSPSPPSGLTGGFAQRISGRENAVFTCRIMGLVGKEVRERVEFIEKFAELGSFFDYPVETYSSGMRGRLVFAVNMAFDFDYYLLDELGAVGDQKFKEKADAALKQKRGRSSFIIVSHSLDQLKRDCQAGLYLKQGTAHYFEQVDEAIAVYKADQREQK